MNKAESTRSTLNLQVETLALSTELVICGLSQLMSAVSTLQGSQKLRNGGTGHETSMP